MILDPDILAFSDLVTTFRARAGTPFGIANLVEAALWSVLSVICLIQSFRSGARHPRELRLASVVLLFFGVSDVVEVTTGAWWRPWWLLCWKAACVAGLVMLLALALVRRRRG